MPSQRNANLRMSLFTLETIAHLKGHIFKPPITVGSVLKMVEEARKELKELEEVKLSSLEPLITDHEGDDHESA